MRSICQAHSIWIMRQALLGLIGMTVCQAALAGVLNKCDNARIAAHDTVLTKYREVLSDLDDRIAQAKIKGVNPTTFPYHDKDDKLRSVDIISLKSDLQDQEAKDVGRVEREIASGCDENSGSVQEAAKIAEAIAMHGISAVLPRHMTNVDMSRSPFGT
jgi:hypothetical protein